MVQTSHSVYFLDSGGRLICEPMLVRQGESATPPAYQPPPGHIFLYWSRSTSYVMEDIFCVALTQQKTRRARPVITFYDGADRVLERRAMEGEAPPPAFAPPEGFRLAGWDVRPDEGEDVFVPAGKPLPRLARDCRAYPRCEPAACRLFAMDLRGLNPKLLPLGSFGCGALISPEDLNCLHLRARHSLRPFRFTIQEDTVLALTEQGARAFGMNMQPIEMHAVWLVENEPAASSHEEKTRVSA